MLTSVNLIALSIRKLDSQLRFHSAGFNDTGIVIVEGVDTPLVEIDLSIP
jgi:hypothetical protein